MTDHIQFHTGGAISFVGPSAVELYRATVIENAIRLYAKCGMRVNRAYTPKAMMAAAAQITGKKFKARDYLGAADAIKAWRTEPANIPAIIREPAPAPFQNVQAALDTREDAHEGETEQANVKHDCDCGATWWTETNENFPQPCPTCGLPELPR